MTRYIIEVDSPNIIAHNKYYKCVGTSYRVSNFEKGHVFTTLSAKITFEKKTNYMLSNHEIWCIHVILYLHFVRQLLTFIC
jgi:hypothetical protein